MDPNYLDFKQSTAQLDAKIEALRYADKNSGLNINEEINRLRMKSRKLTESIFTALTPWQISQVARHPQRPYTLDYIGAIFTAFQELHGDRAFADDPAIVAGIARLEGRPVMVLGP